MSTGVGDLNKQKTKTTWQARLEWAKEKMGRRCSLQKEEHGHGP